ncbi:hypothetical protein KFK09_018479 [Dendrobium nobile]|uniref:Uncharacterized protein n=1 Tax=Dendrobium nobile TaxID=94219 RepID=A0A8T3AVB7_DENNO|nr:hypothetical protein KFK09_018479 [Dendrobium nobile]
MRTKEANCKKMKGLDAYVKQQSRTATSKESERKFFFYFSVSTLFYRLSH